MYKYFFYDFKQIWFYIINRINVIIIGNKKNLNFSVWVY